MITGALMVIAFALGGVVGWVVGWNDGWKSADWIYGPKKAKRR